MPDWYVSAPFKKGCVSALSLTESLHSIAFLTNRSLVFISYLASRVGRHRYEMQAQAPRNSSFRVAVIRSLAANGWLQIHAMQAKVTSLGLKRKIDATDLYTIL